MDNFLLAAVHLFKKDIFSSSEPRDANGRWTSGGGSSSSKSSERKIESLSKERENLKIPQGVTLKDVSYGMEYKYVSANGNNLAVTIGKGLGEGEEGKSRIVNFTINNDFGKKKKQPLSTEEAGRMSVKIAKILQYDASLRPDGTTYHGAAYTGDSAKYGAVRAYAYEKIGGFTRPVGGKPGENQFGIVKNGKIVPDLERLKRKEIELGIPESKIQKAVEKYKKTAKTYRKTQK